MVFLTIFTLRDRKEDISTVGSVTESKKHTATNSSVHFLKLYDLSGTATKKAILFFLWISKVC